jgi:hypothetical protein
MAEQVDTGTKTFTASAAIPQHARVVFEATTGFVKAAAITEKEVGTALTEAFASGNRIAVKLRTAAGTHKMIASAALATLGATVFTAAAGKIGASASTAFQVGTLLTAAAADGDIVEVVYNAHGDTAV